MPHSSSDLRFPKAPHDSAIISGIKGLQDDPRAEGVSLEEIPVGEALEIATGHSTYRLENLGDGNVLISGHPKYCPQPVAAKLHGSIGADGNLRWRYLGKGFRMVFQPTGHQVVRSSAITAIQRLGGIQPSN